MTHHALMGGSHAERLDALIAEMEKAQAWMLKGITEICAVLEPFADVAGEGDEDFPNETKVITRFGRTTYFALKLGDFRRAREAFAKLSAIEGVPNSDETGEMIERVAKALHASLGFEANWPHPECTQCVDAARAAIRAMREPTKETAE